MAIVADQLGNGDPGRRSGIIAGFHGVDSPCQHKDVSCAEGVIVGKDLRQLFLNLPATFDDDDVEREIVQLLLPDMPQKPVPIAFYERASWSHRRLFAGSLIAEAS